MSGDFKVGDVVKHKRTRECMTVTKTETDLLIHCEGLQNETKFWIAYPPEELELCLRPTYNNPPEEVV